MEDTKSRGSPARRTLPPLPLVDRPLSPLAHRCCFHAEGSLENVGVGPQAHSALPAGRWCLWCGNRTLTNRKFTNRKCLAGSTMTTTDRKAIGGKLLSNGYRRMCTQTERTLGDQESGRITLWWGYKIYYHPWRQTTFPPPERLVIRGIVFLTEQGGWGIPFYELGWYRVSIQDRSGQGRLSFPGRPTGSDTLNQMTEMYCHLVEDRWIGVSVSNVNLS